MLYNKINVFLGVEKISQISHSFKKLGAL